MVIGMFTAECSRSILKTVFNSEFIRSPSPAPQYDNFGRRVNTRENRYRKRLEDERHKLIEKAVKVIPNYHPPSDYRRPTKTQEKVYVPVNDYPEINFSMITNPLTPNRLPVLLLSVSCLFQLLEYKLEQFPYCYNHFHLHSLFCRFFTNPA